MPAPQYNGQTLPVYSVAPNWRERVRVRTIYGTHVREKLDLSETRYGRQPRCLYGIQYTTLPLDGQETGYIRRVMELAQGLPVIMPVWTEASKLTVAAGFGDNALQVDDTFPTLLPVLYDYVIVWQDYKTWEILALSSFTDDLLTLGDEVQRAYPVGTLVMPILIGDLKRPPTSQLTDEHGQHNVQFVEVFNGGLTDQSIVEEYNPLPPILISYTDECRAEFVVTVEDLEPATVYRLEVQTDPINDLWAPHIYFALQSTAEIASGIKVLTINNDYNGAAAFRVADFSGEPLSQPGVPEASVVAPPDITAANLSEITTQVQFDAIESALPTATDGLRPLEYYSDGGFILPYSAIEDPLVFTSFTYRRFKRKYALRQWSWGHWGTLLAEGNQNQPVTVTGPAGATIKWTRDGSDPTLATAAPISYGGVANNAYAIEDAFGGILKARCFKDGCRSPLTMVAIDKVMYERPNFRTSGDTKDINGYCDLPVPDPATGGTFETGNGCQYLWGGQCPFEQHIYGIAMAGGSIATSANAPGGHGAMLMWRFQDVRDTTYIGYPIHQVGAQKYDFLGSTWNFNFNGWKVASPIHHWAWLETNVPTPGVTTFSGVIETSVNDTLAGDATVSRAWWDAQRDFTITDEILPDIADVPAPDCFADLDWRLYADRFDIIRSPLYWQEMRNLYWATPAFTPPDIPFDPPPPTPPVNPFDDFAIYVDGDATTQTLDYRTPVDWDSAWVVRNGVASTSGSDLMSAYADGAIPENSTHADGDGYIYFNGGESWELGATVEWVFREGELAKVYYDLFTSYADGAAPFMMNGGYGWVTGEGWVAANDLIGGEEKFDTYADGTFVGAATGTNWIASTPWITR